MLDRKKRGVIQKEREGKTELQVQLTSAMNGHGGKRWFAWRAGRPRSILFPREKRGARASLRTMG
jgi:hypothetical protein